MSNLNSDITIQLGEETCMLRASLKAATAISARFGGINEAYVALGKMQLDAYIFIIRTGIAKEYRRVFTDEQLAEEVWRTGMDDLAEPLARYVNILRHGGRDPEAATDDDDEDDAGNGSLHVS